MHGTAAAAAAAAADSTAAAAAVAAAIHPSLPKSRESVVGGEHERGGRKERAAGRSGARHFERSCRSHRRL